MKRAVLGALLISLVAGSTAMAGTVLPPALHGGGQNDRGGHEQHRPDNRNDNWGGRHDNDHRNEDARFERIREFSPWAT